MRIAVFIDRLAPGAAPKFVGREVRELQRLGHTAEMLALVRSPVDDSPLFAEYLDGIPRRYICDEARWPSWLRFRVPPFTFFTAFDLAALAALPHHLACDAHPYDLIIAHTSISAWIAQRVWQRTGTPYLAFIWDPITLILDQVYRPRLPALVYRLLYRTGEHIDRAILHDAAAAVTGASYQRDWTAARLQRDLPIVFAGTDVAETIPDHRGETLLTLDRWDPGNTPGPLLGVLERLRPLRPTLLVAGFWEPDSLRTAFLVDVARRGLGEQVRVLGAVSEAELRALNRGARAFLFPQATGINFPIQEAAAQGCPAVNPGPTDLFAHGKSGYFPPADDWDAYAQAVRLLLTDERRAHAAGAAAWRVMQQWTWAGHTRSLLASLPPGLLS